MSASACGRCPTSVTFEWRAAWAASAVRSGPSPTITQRASGSRAIAATRRSTFFWATSRPTKPTANASAAMPSSARARARASPIFRGGGTPYGITLTRPGVSPSPSTR